MAPRIQDEEVALATKLAKRKEGITVANLRSKLDFQNGVLADSSLARAREILRRVKGAKATRLGKGKRNREVIFRVK